MKRTKQIGSTMLALALVAALVAGCSGTSDTPASQAPTSQPADSASADSGLDYSEKVKFSFMIKESGAYMFNPEWPTYKGLTEAKNVELDIQPVPGDEYDTKLRIVFNSGDLPHLMSNVQTNMLPEFTSSGLFLKVDEHLNQLPDLQHVLDTVISPESYDNLLDKEGHLYILPFTMEKPIYNTAPMIRGDLLEQYNLEKPQTMDDLYNVLKVFKENDPDHYPFAMRENAANTLMDIAGPSWGIGPAYNNAFLYDSDTNAFTCTYTSENYKAYTEFLHKLLSEGLADPELYTSTFDQWKQKMATGFSSFTYGYISDMPAMNQDGPNLVGPDYEMIVLEPIVGPGGKRCRSDDSSQGTVIAASAANDPHFDRLLDFVNYMSYSEDGNSWFTWGVEGITYEVVDGKKQFTQEVIDTGNIQQQLWNIGACNNIFSLVFPFDYFTTVLNNENIVPFSLQGQEEGWFPVTPKVPKLDFEQQEEERMLLASVQDYQLQMHEAFIFGNTPISEWDNYVAEMEKKGVTRLLEIYDATL